MTEKSFDQVLQQKVGELPQQLQPTRDLWQGIDIALTEQYLEKEFGQEPNGISRDKKNTGSGAKIVDLSDWLSVKPMAVAASLSLVTFISWNAFNGPVNQSGPSQLVSQMMQQHDEQKSVLLASFSQRPELTSNWQAQLQELEEAERAIEAALQNDPENIALLKMLQQVHQQQLELIEAVHLPVWQTI